MSIQDYSAPQTTVARRTRPRLLRLFVVVMSALVLLNLATLLVVGGYQIAHNGLMYPGVSAWGIDLSGMSSEEARAALQDQFVYPESTAFTFHDGPQVWQATASELGVRFDVDRTITAAYSVGRQGSLLASLGEQITAWQLGIAVSPVVVYDQSQAESFVRAIAAQVDRPVVDATISLDGLEVVTTGSQVGRQMDVPATVNALREPIASLQSAEIPLAIVETQPAIADATEAGVTVQAILGEALTLTIEQPLPGDPGPWVAARESLAEALVVERVPNGDGTERYQVHLSEDQLRAFLQPLAPTLSITPVNARFIFDDDTGQLEVIRNAVYGRTLNTQATIAAINQVVVTGQHEMPLVFDVLAPAVPDTATGAELGITELASLATTYFAGSSDVRKTNIAVAASRFHGLVIAPGEEFSFNKYLGDVSQESGFEEGLIIYGGRTVKGVGGGVCQVSTTAFQTAFYAGFPIVERWPHGYRVGYYESGEGAGMDATVFSPIVDFRFINATPYYLLVETYTNKSAGTLTWKFYSTGDGRTVQKDGPYISNVVPHGPTVYEENPEIEPGKTKQVDYAVDGADVTVYRTVYRDGSILYQDTFVSHYLAWQAVFQVAAGHLPSGANTEGNLGDGEVRVTRFRLSHYCGDDGGRLLCHDAVFNDVSTVAIV